MTTRLYPRIGNFCRRGFSLGKLRISGGIKPCPKHFIFQNLNLNGPSVKHGEYKLGFDGSEQPELIQVAHASVRRALPRKSGPDDTRGRHSVRPEVWGVNSLDDFPSQHVRVDIGPLSIIAVGVLIPVVPHRAFNRSQLVRHGKMKLRDGRKKLGLPSKIAANRRKPAQDRLNQRQAPTLASGRK